MLFGLKEDGGIELHLDLTERELICDALRVYSAYAKDHKVDDLIEKICEIMNVLEGKGCSVRMINYERIKEMTVDEMANFLDDMQTDALFLEGTIHDLKYTTDWKQWLESEVEGE